jgi:hypothetical protein
MCRVSPLFVLLATVPAVAAAASCDAAADDALGAGGCPATGRSAIQYAHAKTPAEAVPEATYAATVEDGTEQPSAASMAQSNAVREEEDGQVSVREAVMKVGQTRRDLQTAALLAESRRAAAKTEVAKALEQEADTETGAAEQLARAEKDVASALRSEAAARLDAARAEDETHETVPDVIKTQMQEEAPRVVAPQQPPAAAVPVPSMTATAGTMMADAHSPITHLFKHTREEWPHEAGRPKVTVKA